MLSTATLPALDTRSGNEAGPTERTAELRALWLRYLGPKAREPDAHILHIGVGLKRILRLRKALQQELGVDIPATALMRLGTADAVDAAIRVHHWPAPSPCVLLKDGDASPPLYMLSAGSGLVLELCELARLVDYPGQVWGVQAPGLDGEAEPLNDVAAFGAHYASAIMARQPAGPYHLVGYSFGGSAAIETARAMAAAGGAVGLVGLIDANLDERNWPRRAWLAGVLRRCWRRLADARHMPPREAVRHIAIRARNLLQFATRKLAGETAASVHRSAYYIGGLEPAFQAVRDASISAYQAYTPRRFDQATVLFRSVLGDPHACDPAPVWRQFIRRLEVVDCPGSHTTMVRPPHARRLAAEIVSRLR